MQHLFILYFLKIDHSYAYYFYYYSHLIRMVRLGYTPMYCSIMELYRCLCLYNFCLGNKMNFNFVDICLRYHCPYLWINTCLDTTRHWNFFAYDHFILEIISNTINTISLRIFERLKETIDLMWIYRYYWL